MARLKIDDPIVAAEADMPTVRLVDLTAAIYGAEYCEPVVGNIVVWRDMQHRTATYAAALADQLAIRAAFLPAP